MTDKVAALEVSDCSCLRVRRVSRCLTQHFDQILKPAGVTVSQVGLLVSLRRTACSGLSLSALAGQLAMDHSTLNRKLGPLLARGLVTVEVATKDRRLRVARLTAEGGAVLARAEPLRRRAQRSVEDAIGLETVQTLNVLLDLAASRFRRPPRW
jgi:DNA-binding MarR family transcriptional regulator